MKYNVYNYYGDINFDYEELITQAGPALIANEPSSKSKSANVILIDDLEIKKVNYQYRKIDNITDVLSFNSIDIDDIDYIGDIFINIDRVYEQAKKYQHSVEREFTFLLTHASLHLLGYNHLNLEEERLMFTKQNEILESINLRR